MRTFIIIISFLSILGGYSAHAQVGLMVDTAARGAGTLGVKVGQSIAQDGISGTIDTAKELASDPIGSIAKGIGSVMLGSFQLDMLGKLLWGLNYTIAFIGSILFTIAAFLVQIGLYFNITILSSPVVQLGWRIMRDLANLGFTIGIVVIAYTTILGIAEYGTKKALASLIIAAVLINFSFSIAGVFIDASNMVTHFFVSKSITGSTGAGALPFSGSRGADLSLAGWRNSGAGELAETLADAFGPQRLLVVDQNNQDAFAQLSSSAGILVMVAATFFIAFFTILAALGMLAVGAVTLWRFIVLSGLMIIMPGAILAWGIASTGTGTLWNKWRSEFITQLIHLPIIAFFLYLTITFIKLQGKAAASGQLSVKDIAALSDPSIPQLLAIMAHPLQVMVEMLLLLGLLFWGLTQAGKWSGQGSGFIIDRIQGMGDWIMSTGKSKGAGAREWATRKIGTTGEEPDKNLANRAANITAKLPGAGGLTKWLRGVSSTALGKVDEYAKEYGAYTHDQLVSKARNPDIRFNAEKMAGMAKVIAQKGKISADPTKGLTMQEFEKFIGPAKRFGLDTDVLKMAPHLFERFGWDISKFNTFMEKDFKPDTMDTVSADALKDKRVAFRLTAAHLQRLDGPDKKDHRKNFITTFNEDMTDEQRRLFMNEQFKNKKDVDDIHPDFFTSQKLVTGLKGFHVDRLRDNTDFKQQAAFIKTLSEAYDDSDIPDETLNNLAKPLIDKKTDNGWTGIMNTPETKKMFDKIEAEYKQRTHPYGGGGVPPPQPGGGTPRGGRGAGGGAGSGAAPQLANPGIPPNPTITPPPQQINRSPNTPL